MRIDFFAPEYIHTPLSDRCFGINDSHNDVPAYVTTDTSVEWNATVNNPLQKHLLFTPIDYNVIFIKDDGSKDKSCDAMITSDNAIVFVELKNQKANWINNAIEQLKTTIGYFKDYHDINQFSSKKAYIANSQHPCFHYSMKDTLLKFRQDTKFRLSIEATITI